MSGRERGGRRFTFLGVPAGAVPSPRRPLAADVVVIGAPWEERGSIRPGTALGASTIRAADYMPQLPVRPHLALGVDPLADLRVVDAGDVEPRPWRPGGEARRLELIVCRIVAAGATPVVLGGGPAAARAALTGAARADGWAGLGLLHLDAHAAPPGVPAVEIGRRAWSAGGGRGWRWCPAEVARDGADACVASALGELSGATRPVFVVVDLDVADPGMAPGTASPEPGGLSSRELLDAVRRAAMGLPRLGLAVVNLTPPYDRAEATARLANRVVLEFMSGIAWRRRRIRGEAIRDPAWPLARRPASASLGETH